MALFWTILPSEFKILNFVYRGRIKRHFFLITLIKEWNPLLLKKLYLIPLQTSSDLFSNSNYLCWRNLLLFRHCYWQGNTSQKCIEGNKVWFHPKENTYDSKRNCRDLIMLHIGINFYIYLSDAQYLVKIFKLSDYFKLQIYSRRSSHWQLKRELAFSDSRWRGAFNCPSYCPHCTRDKQLHKSQPHNACSFCRTGV